MMSSLSSQRGRSTSFWRWCRVAALASSLIACSSAFSRAVDAGDQFAKAGRWEEATRSYERALQLKPGDSGAKEKLLHARREHVDALITQGKRALEAGKFVEALKHMRAARIVDPASELAQRAQRFAIEEGTNEAEALLRKGRARPALEILEAARRDAPRDARIAELEERARLQVATEVYAQAEALEKQGHAGNALLAYADVSRVLPGHRDAARRAVALREALEKDLRYLIVLAPAPGESTGTREVRRRVIDAPVTARWPLLVLTEQAPAGTEPSYTASLELRGYRYDENVETLPRSCDYVCGQDRVANPEYAAVRARMQSARDRLPYAEQSLQQAIQIATQAVRDVESARRELATAEAEYRAAPQAENQAQWSRRNAAQDAVSRAERRQREADDEVGRARRERDKVHAEQNEASDALSRTPRERLVDRVCSFDYSVARHTRSVNEESVLRGRFLGDAQTNELGAQAHRVSVDDETHAPIAGRCSELQHGDPLQLPNERQLAAQLQDQVVEANLLKLAKLYEQHRDALGDQAKNARRAGDALLANEAQVAFWLLSAGEPEALRVQH